MSERGDNKQCLPPVGVFLHRLPTLNVQSNNPGKSVNKLKILS